MRPSVSRLVLSKFRGHIGFHRITVQHSTELPIGCGYGTSGAGALSLALALNAALDEPLSRLEAAQIAHTAEVEAHTGLGTVAGEFMGGPVARLKPGAPGIGVTRKLRFGKNSRVVSASFGPFRKSRVLGNERLSNRVNYCGRSLMRQLMKQPREESFIRLSRQFNSCLALSSPRVRQATRRLESRGILPSMMMLGESLFCLIQGDDVERARRAFNRAGLDPVVSQIAYQGARLL